MDIRTKRILQLSLKYFLLLTAGLLLTTVRFSYSSYTAGDISSKTSFFQPVIKKLVAMKVDTNFIYRIISDKRTKFEEKFVRINVTGYLKKSDYSKSTNRTAVVKCSRFIAANYQMLDQAEKKYGVPKEAITSILWVETRFGGYLGSNNIITVFLSTAMAGQPQFVKLNKDELRSNFSGDSLELEKLEKKLEARSRKKTEWALGELASLSKMQKLYSIDVSDIEGSWAGAFGMSQFLPSSYLRCGVDGNGDNKVNLFNVDDAIFSVGNYLKTYGWGPSLEEQRKAVFGYNNSDDYVNAILSLMNKTIQYNRLKVPIEEQVQDTP